MMKPSPAEWAPSPSTGRGPTPGRWPSPFREKVAGGRMRVFPLLLLLLSTFSLAARVEIREGRFYVDGEPFYVRGVGYAPWRPHQHPGVSYSGTNHRWTKMDFE